MQDKTCKQCHVYLPGTSFHANQSRCKQCRAASKDWRRELLKKARDRCRRYGWPDPSLTVDDLQALYEQQGGKCVFSGVPLNTVYEHTGQRRKCPADRISLDRISDRGFYTLDNVQLVTDRANHHKSARSNEEYVEHCVRVALKSGRVIEAT